MGRGSSRGTTTWCASPTRGPAAGRDRAAAGRNRRPGLDQIPTSHAAAATHLHERATAPIVGRLHAAPAHVSPALAERATSHDTPPGPST